MTPRRNPVRPEIRRMLSNHRELSSPPHRTAPAAEAAGLPAARHLQHPQPPAPPTAPPPQRDPEIPPPVEEPPRPIPTPPPDSPPPMREPPPLQA
ncbi:MAG TPA: hypothetical protein VGD08_14100 [Stellaceae bacterium]